MKVQKTILIFGVVTLFVGIAYFFIVGHDREIKGEVLGTSQTLQNYELPETLPIKKNLDVPFTPQAPYAVWDYLHNEACEEAALIMVHYYLEGKKLNKELAEKEIQNLIVWQEQEIRGQEDLNVDQMAQLTEKYWGYKTRVIKNASIEDIKKEIAAGNPVIIPAAGRLLGNPNFRYPGPLFHYLVIKGYDDRKRILITNDGGTRRGHNYQYSYETINQSWHDWKNDQPTGAKNMLIIER